MKHILIFIFTINAYAEICSNNANLSPELDPIVEELTLKDCYKKSSLEKICKCNKKNEKFNLEKMQPEFDQANNKIKIDAAKNIFDQAKKSFFQIAQNLTVLDSTTSVSNVGSSCSLSRINTIQCDGHSVLNLLNKDNRGFLDKFKNDLKIELESRLNPYSEETNGLINRRELANKRSCNISDKEVFQIDQENKKISFLELVNKFSLLGENTGQTILDRILSNVDKIRELDNLSELNQKMIYNFLRNPIINEFLKSDISILSGDISTKNLQETLNSKQLEDKLAETQIQNCENTYQNLEKFLCSNPNSLKSSEDSFKENLKASIPYQKDNEQFPKDSPEYLNFQIETTQKIIHACNNIDSFSDDDSDFIESFNKGIPEVYKKKNSSQFINTVYEETSVEPRNEICAELLKDEGLVTGKIVNIYADYKPKEKYIVQAKSKKKNLLPLPKKELGPNLTQFLGGPAPTKTNVQIAQTQEGSNATANSNPESETASDHSSKEMVSFEKRSIASSTRKKKSGMRNQGLNEEESRGTSVADMKYQSRTSPTQNYGKYEQKKMTEADANAMSDILNQMRSRRKKLKEDINEIATSKGTDKKKMIDEYRELTEDNRALTDEYKRLKEKPTPKRTIASNDLDDEVSDSHDNSLSQTSSSNSQSDSPATTPANGRKIASSKNGRSESKKGYYNTNGDFVKDSGIEVTNHANNFGVGIVGEEIKEVVLDPGLEEFKLEDIKKAFESRRSKNDILKFMDIVEKEDAFIISQYNNKENKVLIKKEGDSYRIIQKGDSSDPKFKEFYQNVVKAFNENIFDQLKDQKTKRFL